jgi:hypothetical protein
MFRFPPEVIVVAVRWHLRFNLSYRDVEELLAKRGVEVGHVTVFCWVQRFAPLLPTRPGYSVTPVVTDGMSLKRTSRSSVFGRYP